MKQIIRSAGLILSGLILAMSVKRMSVPAAESVTAEIPVQVRLTGDVPEPPEKFSIILTAEDPHDPMPEGADAGTFTLVMTGDQTRKFPAITYTAEGIYHYTIHQKRGSEEQASYDDHKYYVVVSVIRTEHGNLGISVGVHKNSVTEQPKAGEIEFVNRYKTSGGGGGGGGGGDPKTNVPEPPAPLVSIFPFDIPSALPQTGTMWWIVGILTLAGLTMAAGGAVRSRAKERIDQDRQDLEL